MTTLRAETAPGLMVALLPSKLTRLIALQIGAPFDYNIHNAIMRENTNEISEDCVCQVSESNNEAQPFFRFNAFSAPQPLLN